ncbi:hypothetical protein BRSU_2445 [Brachyspira suanatina]|uniref:Uncharacterized protein n=1 Tax=Brachyspira suanatina TaxID=381802 RepID=A0A0G4K9W1_9SPIR|nr:hypothetical protein [Brachyspira suanatina]CRF35123.1 hypothetical protein BRSU_2445 [Brachyspira suanatina]
MLCIKKYIIRIILKIAFFLYLFNSALFAEIDFNIIIPISSSYTFSDMKLTTLGMSDSLVNTRTLKDNIGIEIGILSQIGYNFNTKNSIFKSIGIMAEIGYILSPIYTSYEFYDNSYTLNVNHNILFHTLNIGAIQKFYIIDKLSLGIGGGIRIPFSANLYGQNDGSPLPFNNGKYDYNYIKSLFKRSIIPYIKFSLEGYYFFNDFVSLVIGAHFTYSMGMEYNADKLNEYISYIGTGMKWYHSYSYSSIETGLTIGVSIGRKGSNDIKRIE